MVYYSGCRSVRRFFIAWPARLIYSKSVQERVWRIVLRVDLHKQDAQARARYGHIPHKHDDVWRARFHRQTPVQIVFTPITWSSVTMAALYKHKSHNNCWQTCFWTLDSSRKRTVLNELQNLIPFNTKISYCTSPNSKTTRCQKPCVWFSFTKCYWHLFILLQFIRNTACRLVSVCITGSDPEEWS